MSFSCFLADRNAGDIPLYAFCVVWLYGRCSFAPLKAWVDPVRRACRAVQGHIPPSRALSARHYVDSSSSSSNLGSSGEDLSVCPGAQVLIHWCNTTTTKKKNAVCFTAGWKSQSLFNEAASHCEPVCCGAT